MAYMWAELSDLEKKNLLAVNVMEWSDLNAGIWLQPDGRWMPKSSWNPISNIGHAWQVFQQMKQQLFSKRRVFMDHLQNVVSSREVTKGHTYKIDWPDVFWFVKSEDICLAALKASGVDIE